MAGLSPLHGPLHGNAIRGWLTDVAFNMPIFLCQPNSFISTDFFHRCMYVQMAAQNADHLYESSPLSPVSLPPFSLPLHIKSVTPPAAPPQSKDSPPHSPHKSHTRASYPYDHKAPTTPHPKPVPCRPSWHIPAPYNPAPHRHASCTTRANL